MKEKNLLGPKRREVFLFFLSKIRFENSNVERKEREKICERKERERKLLCQSLI